jgi:hypothetical protein
MEIFHRVPGKLQMPQVTSHLECGQISLGSPQPQSCKHDVSAPLAPKPALLPINLLWPVKPIRIFHWI